MRGNGDGSKEAQVSEGLEVCAAHDEAELDRDGVGRGKLVALLHEQRLGLLVVVVVERVILHADDGAVTAERGTAYPLCES